MNEISTITSQTMSSLEISKLTEKRHSDVVSDIRRILDEAEIEGAPFIAPYKMPSGQVTNVYNLPRIECDLVVSGYSVKYRLAIIKRWHELESNPLTELEMIARTALALNDTNKRVEEQRLLIREHDARLNELESDRSALETMLEMNLKNKIENSEDHPWGKQRAVSHILGKITK
jgi:phage regulator Rha-like protein